MDKRQEMNGNDDGVWFYHLNDGEIRQKQKQNTK